MENRTVSLAPCIDCERYIDLWRSVNFILDGSDTVGYKIHILVDIRFFILLDITLHLHYWKNVGRYLPFSGNCKLYLATLNMALTASHIYSTLSKINLFLTSVKDAALLKFFENPKRLCFWQKDVKKYYWVLEANRRKSRKPYLFYYIL